MKTSMKKLVLDALERQYAGMMDAQRRQIDSYRSANEMVTKDRDRLRELVDEHGRGKRPIHDLYRAAEKVVNAKTPAARRKAISHLSAAMCVAEKHVDLIPF